MKRNIFIKNVFLIYVCVITAVIFTGCISQSVPTTETESQFAVVSSVPTTRVDINDNEINSMLKIYEESMENNIRQYCENYLTYNGNPDVKGIKNVITEEYNNSLSSVSGYMKEDKSYEQATALNELYYGNYSTPTNDIKILALCYQTVVKDNKSTTYNTFYIFSMKYSNEKGWLIDSVDKPSYEY